LAILKAALQDPGAISGSNVLNWLCRGTAATTVALALSGCVATGPQRQAGLLGRGAYDPKYGVWASPKVVPDGEPIPHGGGVYLVGRPYVVAGRTYYPNARPFEAVGVASWYGSNFQGRRTANGEIFDKDSVAAAHPTMPLPSYARVTNLGNNRSIIVRVNDRGPYAAGRVMDVSERVAEALDFKNRGTAHVKVEYLGRASLAGSDEERLMASLRTDGTLASLDGIDGDMASQAPPPWPKAADAAAHPPPPTAEPAAATEVASNEATPTQTTVVPRNAPVPPSRPFDLGWDGRSKQPLAALAFAARAGNPPAGSPLPIPRPDILNFADSETAASRWALRGPFGRLTPQDFVLFRNADAP
jgi:rare lipoprotein A